MKSIKYLLVVVLSCLLITALQLTVLSVPSFSQPRAIVIRAGSIQSSSHPIVQGLQRFSKLVGEKTNNAVQVQVYPDSQLGNAIPQIEGVKLGTQEMFVDGASFATQFGVNDYAITIAPFLFQSSKDVRKIMGGPIGKAMAEELRKKQGILVLNQQWDAAPRELLTKKPVLTPKDIKGLKIRVPEIRIFLETWRALGASPTPMAFGEIFTGLQQGTIDGLELPLDMIYTQKHYEVAKFIALTHHCIGTQFVLINEKFFNGLPPAYQTAIMQAVNGAGDYQNELVQGGVDKVKTSLSQAGVKFAEIDFNEWKKLVKDLPSLMEEKNVWGKGLYAKAAKELGRLD